MPVPPLCATGRLPLGRYSCTEAEVQSAFVDAAEYAQSTTRPDIWHDWLTARDFVRNIVRVHAVWMAGSFVSEKLNPSDLDVTFLIDGESYNALQDYQKRLLAPLAIGGDGKPIHGLRLDGFMVHWACVPEPVAPSVNPMQDQYYYGRGHWDDFWQRVRSGSKGDPAVPADALPLRGYLEVELDGYS